MVACWSFGFSSEYFHFSHRESYDPLFCKSLLEEVQ